MSPEDWKSVGETLMLILAGAGGLFTTQKIHSRLQPSPPSMAEENGSAMLAAVDRIEGKIDKLGGSVRGIKGTVEALEDESQRQGHEISRLSSGFREVVGRVEVLESRITRPM